MSHVVFISYSSLDEEPAKEVCALLESKGIDCWLARRDISAGDYPARLLEAINGSKAIVLIFSDRANASPHVRREVELAITRGIPIIPVRIEDATPVEAMEYLLSTVQRLDAFPPPLKRHLDNVAIKVQQILGQPVSAPTPRISNRAIIKVKWPTSWSCFVPWEVQTIDWEAVSSEGCVIRRFTVELYLEELFIKKIGEEMRSGFSLWLVPDSLRDSNKYRIKVTAWDDDGPVGSSMSDFFGVWNERFNSIVQMQYYRNRWQRMRDVAWVGIGVAIFALSGCPSHVKSLGDAFALLTAAIFCVGLAGWTGGLMTGVRVCRWARITLPVAAVIGGCAGWLSASFGFSDSGIDKKVAYTFFGALLALYVVVQEYEKRCRDNVDVELFLKNLHRLWQTVRTKFATGENKNSVSDDGHSTVEPVIDSCALGRDAHWNAIDEVYFDAVGKPEHRVKRIYDQGGFCNQARLLEARYFDPNGEVKQLSKAFRYHRVKIAYDERGNVSEEAYFDSDEEPTTDNNGFTRITFTYNGHTPVARTGYRIDDTEVAIPIASNEAEQPRTNC